MSCDKRKIEYIIEKMLARIVAAASALPKDCMTNDEFIKRYNIESTSEWIESRTGIQERRFAESQEEFEKIIIESAVKSIKKAYELDLMESAEKNMKSSEKNEENLAEIVKSYSEKIEGVIVATSTNFYHFPGISQIVHKALKLKKTARAIDINAACNGFMVALSIADMWIRSEGLNNILVIGADMMSQILDMFDRSTSCLFADAAGSVLVKRSNEKGILAWEHRVESEHCFELYAREKIYMNGRNVFDHAIKTFEELTIELLKKTNKTIDEIDLIIPHQANARMFETLARRLNIDIKKIPFLAKKTANTSAATIPVALSELELKNKTVILLGFGAGFTASGNVVSL